MIPVVILNALAGKPLPIYGDGGNIRDWLYVEDHADALLLVLEEGEVGRSYNIGGENEWTNLELVHTLCAILDRLQPRASGSYADLIAFVADRPGHDARYAIDPSRIRDELGWRPSVTVDEGLEKTVRWYLDNEDWWCPNVSWAEFASEIFAQASRSVNVVPIQTTEYPTPAKRPLNSRMDCRTTVSTFGVKQPDWRIGLNKILKELEVTA